MYFHQVYLYWLASFILFFVAIIIWKDKKDERYFTKGLFWFLYGILFLIGDWTYQLINNKKLINVTVGVLVIILSLIASTSTMKSAPFKIPTKNFVSSRDLEKKIFFPIILIPVITMIGIIFLKTNNSGYFFLFGSGKYQAVLVSLFSITIGTILGLVVACKITQETPLQSLQQTGKVLNAVGWTFMLPQVLAILGLLSNQSGMGTAISWLADSLYIQNRFITVALYVLSMALFSMIMGNSFASFPIISSGIGIPILINKYGGNPEVVASIGMLSGYCGTLMTPMAANFNIIPTVLLNIPDKYAVIKTQIPTSVSILIINIFLLYYLMRL